MYLWENASNSMQKSNHTVTVAYKQTTDKPTNSLFNELQTFKKAQTLYRDNHQLLCEIIQWTNVKQSLQICDNCSEEVEV